MKPEAMMIAVKEEGSDEQYITPPPSFQIPQTEDFDIVVTVHKEEDGRLCIKKIDGIPMEEETSEEEVVETEEPADIMEAGRQSSAYA